MRQQAKAANANQNADADTADPQDGAGKFANLSPEKKAELREARATADEKAEELHFLPKPFGLKQLAAKVKEVLSAAPPMRRVG